MRKRSMLGALVAMLALAMLPAHANDPVQDLTSDANRYAPQAAGTKQDLRFVFGPWTIPAGVDRNQVTVDLPLQTGFATRVFPNLINVATGQEFTEQQAHIHHAHWFRATADGSYEMYAPGLSWVFGTGEERTGGSLRARSSTAEPWTYGIYSDGTTPQVLIFMIHNKTASAFSAYITLDVEFEWGTRAEIAAATGKDIHPLRGVLTGTTQDAVTGLGSNNGVLAKTYTSDFSGTIIASASHMHPGGEWVYLTNLGPKVNGKYVCGNTANAEAVTDIDGDKIPGTTLFVSKKIDRFTEAWPYSEEYQMGGTQGGFRAPIHLGDVIKQYGIYDEKRVDSKNAGWPAELFRSDPLNPASLPDWSSKDGLQHAWYEAMSYTGFYSDDDAAAQPAVHQITSASQCTPDNFSPDIAPGAGFSFNDNPRDTFATRPDWGIVDQHCGFGTWHACEGSAPNYVSGWTIGDQHIDAPIVTEIHSAGFNYVWGDEKLSAPFNVLPRVKVGSTVRLINEDVALGGVRHTFTSCPWPCSGDYVANYPLPDGRFDSGKLGNTDYVDGGGPQTDGNSVYLSDDTVPEYDLKIDGRFAAGQKYSYFCSIHPWMRGAFQVVS